MINEKIAIKIISRMIDSGKIEVDFDSKMILLKDYVREWESFKKIMLQFGMRYEYSMHCFVQIDNAKLFKLLNNSLVKYQ